MDDAWTALIAYGVGSLLMMWLTRNCRTYRDHLVAGAKFLLLVAGAVLAMTLATVGS